MASSVTLHEAQEKFAELLDRAESGEEIVIEREGRAAAKIVTVPAENLLRANVSLAKTLLASPFWTRTGMPR